jgi:hypothetical protein
MNIIGFCSKNDLRCQWKDQNRLVFYLFLINILHVKRIHLFKWHVRLFVLFASSEPYVLLTRSFIFYFWYLVSTWLLFKLHQWVNCLHLLFKTMTVTKGFVRWQTNIFTSMLNTERDKLIVSRFAIHDRSCKIFYK